MALPAQRADDTAVYVGCDFLDGEVQVIGAYEPAMCATRDEPGNAASFEVHAVYDLSGAEIGDSLDHGEIAELAKLACKAAALPVYEECF